MSPKEQATSLFDKFYNELSKDIDHPLDLNNKAKGCAIIAVDEIILTLDLMELSERGKVVGGFGQGYWNQVKEELSKL